MTFEATANQAIMEINMVVFMADSEMVSLAKSRGLVKVAIKAAAPMILGNEFMLTGGLSLGRADRIVDAG